jgi:hypothetical protein
LFRCGLLHTPVVAFCRGKPLVVSSPEGWHIKRGYCTDHMMMEESNESTA